MYSSHFVKLPPPYHPFRTSYHPPLISPLNSALNQRKIDTEFFENFINSCTSHTPKNAKKNRLSISGTRKLIFSIKSLTISLENSTNILKNNKNSLDFNWNQELEKCKNLKIQIGNLMCGLNKNERIIEFKKLIEQRKKKRMREKRRKELWKLQKNLREEKRNKIDKVIDNWIRIKQEVIDKVKQDENLRKDADLVLADVRGKKSDARRYLNVLRELKNLRRVKAANARGRGENLSSVADESFERIITGLIEQWSELDREYSIEEQGLKLMLKSDNQRVIDKRKLSVFDEWEIAIFGRKLGYLGGGRDLRQLVMIRCAWDRFIGEGGGKIPLGWVIQEVPSSAAWQKCLKR